MLGRAPCWPEKGAGRAERALLCACPLFDRGSGWIVVGSLLQGGRATLGPERSDAPPPPMAKREPHLRVTLARRRIQGTRGPTTTTVSTPTGTTCTVRRTCSLHVAAELRVRNNCKPMAAAREPENILSSHGIVSFRLPIAPLSLEYPVSSPHISETYYHMNSSLPHT